jgi:hypothetical protein
MTDNASAGATPAVPGATPGQTPAQPAAAPAMPPPATGNDDPLGEGGKRALEAERTAARNATKRADDLQRELDTLRAASLTDQEKAIAEARKAGATEVLGKAQQIARRAEVRRALSGAGVPADSVDLAAGASDFADLAVGDDGMVDGLDKAVTAFKGAHPTLFAAKAGGSFDTGLGGGRPGAARTYTRSQLRDTEFFSKNRDDIMAAMKEGRITNG